MTLAVHDLPVFAAAALALNLTPGSDMLYALATAARAGRRVGIAAALGIGAGCLVHVTLAVAGVSALIAASPAAFTLLKLAGAAWLLWLGVGAWRAAARPAAADAAPMTAHATTSLAAFRQGVLVNALNPKVALFFLALLPQFIDATAGAGPQALAFLALGLWFTLEGTLVTVAVAALAGGLQRHLGPGRPWQRRIDRLAAAVYVGLGLRLAFASR